MASAKDPPSPSSGMIKSFDRRRRLSLHSYIDRRRSQSLIHSNPTSDSPTISNGAVSLDIPSERRKVDLCLSALINTAQEQSSNESKQAGNSLNGSAAQKHVAKKPTPCTKVLFETRYSRMDWLTPRFL